MKKHGGVDDGFSDPLLSGVPPLTVLWQLIHVCWMQIRIRLREWDTFSEMVFPVIVVGVYCLLFSIVEQSTSNDGGLDLYTAFQTPPLGTKPEDGVLKLTYPPDAVVEGPLWFSVDTTAGSDYWKQNGRTIIEDVVEEMLHSNNFYGRKGTIRWFDDHTVMERILCTTEDETTLPFASVTFGQHFTLHKSCLTLGRRKIMTSNNFKNFTTGIHYTLHSTKIPKPSVAFSSVKPYVPSKTRMYAKGLARFQHSLDTAFYEAMYGKVKSVPNDITYQRFPPPTDVISMRLGNLSETGSTDKIRYACEYEWKKKKKIIIIKFKKKKKQTNESQRSGFQKRRRTYVSIVVDNDVQFSSYSISENKTIGVICLLNGSWSISYRPWNCNGNINYGNKYFNGNSPGVTITKN